MRVKLQDPSNETARLAALRDLVVLESEPEAFFDSITRLASEVCGAPIALISLVDAERQWFKANVGLPGLNETPRDVAFCAHAIESDALFQVPDATRDTRFSDNPLVIGATDIRFYAGAPLVLPHGERVGTLCVLDRQARQLDAAQVRMLHSLAAIVSQALVMRRDLIDRALAVRSEYERALSDAEAHYRTLVEEQSELVSLSRADGELVYANPAYARHFGLTQQEMAGANLFDFIDPADGAAVRELRERVLITGESMSGENRIVSAAGVEKWVAWTNRRQLDAQLRPMLHSVGRDITERKLVDRTLRASQSLLYRTGRVAGVGGWEVDLSNNTVTWSDETRRIHEVTADHVPTVATAIAFYAPEARAVIQAAIQTAIDQRQPWDLELPFITATQRHIWVRTVGGVEFEGSRAVRLVGAFQDITKRKELEQRLEGSELFVRQITDNLPVGIAYVDRDSRFRFVNVAQCQRFGLEREQILGHTRSELIDGDADDMVGPFVQAVLAGQPQQFEHDESTANGPRRIESRLVPDISGVGEVRGFFSTGFDITERSNAERSLRELTAILDNTTDYVVQTDRRGKVRYMNRAARSLVGLALDAPVTRRNFGEFNTPSTNRNFVEVIVPAVKADGVWIGQSAVYRHDQLEIPVSQMVIAHRNPSGRIDRYSSVMRDISVELRAQQQQQRLTTTLRSITEAIPALVSVLGADERYRFVNAGFERWWGGPRDSIVGLTMLEVLGRVEHESSRPWVQRVLRGETVHFERAYPGRDATRHLSINYIPLWLDSGAVDGFVAVVQDISPQKQEQLRLVQLTQRDKLTGLLNRAGFEDHLERQLELGGGSSVALLYIDLDHFKHINDVYGHPAGDQVLQIFAQRVLKLVRPSDAVVRLGGDEFAIVLAGIPQNTSAQTVAAKVIAAAHAAFSVDGHQLRIGASVGLAFGVDPVGGWRDLVARADANLYRAKAAGRGRQAG
jgi:diguanylate cyclase (GGDEF)-like protein/PAS domain S-box-containing protein